MPTLTADRSKALRLEDAIHRIAEFPELEGHAVSPAALAALLLKGDADIEERLGPAAPAVRKKVRLERAALEEETAGAPIDYLLALRYRTKAARLASGVWRRVEKTDGWRARADAVLTHPVSGTIVLAAVLYLGFYQFIGQFAAGTVVGFIERVIFEGYLNPLFVRFSAWLPWTPLRDLLAGEYGILTLGLRYAAALILPIVSFFFFVFGVVEDTGYLPRLSMLANKPLNGLGLSGRAAIPLVLGFGCATMATLVTRTLPTRRERLIATLLLSLAVPCSAQWAVILALLSGSPKAMLLWAAAVGSVFILAGAAASRFLPGKAPSFFMELPPLRMPRWGNIVQKTFMRVRWYFLEILPLFLAISVFMWAARLTGLFEGMLRLLKPALSALGLPAESAPAFVFGFFRRDYGAAGLYDLAQKNLLDWRQLTVASVALTLFLPCVAQFMVNMKERGWKTGLAVSAFVLAISFVSAAVLNAAIVRFGLL